MPPAAVIWYRFCNQAIMRLVCLFSFLLITHQLFAQDRKLELEYAASSALSHQIPSLENLSRGEGVSASDLDQFDQRIGLNFRIQPKFWLGFSAARQSFSKMNLNFNGKLSNVEFEGSLRGLETQLWYRPRARKNQGLGAYMGFRYSPINLSVSEIFLTDQGRFQATSVFNGNLVQLTMGAKGYVYLKPITNLGLSASVNFRPLLMNESYRSVSLESLESLSSNGFGADYRLGINYRLTRFYAGLGFGQQVYQLKSRLNDSDRLRIRFSSISFQLGFFFLKRRS